VKSKLSSLDTTTQVSLERTAAGTPSRLIVQTQFKDKDRVKLAGGGTARWRNNEKVWSTPVDPYIVRRMVKMFDRDELEITDEVWHHLRQRKRRQEKILDATENEAPLNRIKGLWDFQRSSVRFLLESGKGILAHDMGTGKTVITAGALAEGDIPRVLIVCPNTLKWSWAEHIYEWTGRTPVILESGLSKHNIKDEGMWVLYGNGPEREEYIGEVTAEDEWILIVNYYHVRDHTGMLERATPVALAVDEAHRIKNNQAKQTKAVHKIADSTDYAWLLTGTPVRNNYDDYWGLLRACDPYRFSSYWNFLDLYLHAYPGMHGGVEIVGVKNEDYFNRMLSSYMFRKTKDEVMEDLPEKVYNDIPIPMTTEQEQAYKQMEKEFLLFVEKEMEDGKTLEEILVAPNVVAQMIRLRQICLTPAILGRTAESARLNALKDMLVDLKRDEDPFVVYTAFKQFIPYLENLLDEQDLRYGRIVGGQSSEERRQTEHDLNNGNIDAVVGTIQAMGEGLNLQMATTALFCDIDWTPAVNRQAEDRIHRAGIKTSPTIINMYHPGTIEDHIRAVNKRKEKIESETLGKIEIVRDMMRNS